ncbi:MULTISPECIES: MFS transporter [unclassified Bradyrhizobium]|uniref:MFS transporter n=1 Tax=unclassified Bradyrhizobium TaxID=2631580 RepID=UPI0028EBE3A6|nr:MULTISPECIES: MFS transporter [unclassified Bradyrhizobium]
MTLAAPLSSELKRKKSFARQVIATSVGNALEWFDIAVYGFFAVYISKAFFPSNDATTSLLLTFGTFGLSYLIRPIGGIVLGAYADRHGRKVSLLVSIVMMTFGTLAVAVMPTYQTIGVLAPLLVILARLVQGFSAGGEFGSSTAFLVEHMPERRGFIASWQFASQGLSTVLGAGFGALLTSAMSPADLQAWGWRLPFFFGVLIGPVGLYIRNNMEDAGAPPAGKDGSPVKDVFLRQKLAVLLGIGALAVSTAINYLIVYIPTYVVKTLNLPASVGFTASLVGSLAVMVLTPVAGAISDRIGRTTHMITVNLLLLITIYPAFYILTNYPTPAVIIAAVFVVATLKALYYGPLAALMAELLPAETRATGLGLGYNIGVTIFGGMGPAIMTALGTVAFIGDMAPGYYLSLIALLSLASLFTIRKLGATA